MLDNLVRQFSPANADFVSACWQARVIVDSAASRAVPTVTPTPTTPVSANLIPA
jgi:hypothetical protein